jgi:energy-coupling factor transport system ATP-binding protein
MRRATQALRESTPISKPNTPSVSAVPVIEIARLTVAYATKIALDSITTTVFDKEIVAVMGRNGAGKSSLLRSIAGVNEMQTGDVRVHSLVSKDLHSKLRRQTIGYIPQEPSDLLYAQSVERECEQADKDNQIPPGTTYSVLAQLVPGISLHTHPRDLSEGQRLGLALSVVLSANPKVLILDEPTRGLDYEAKKSLTRILLEFASIFNRAVVIATHDVELVAELASRTIFLADGEIVADGPTIELLLSSPAFAPQVAKVMSPQPWLRVRDVIAAIESKSP